MISIIIPAYNEETKIKQTIEKIIREIYYKAESFEIIVVNDGSKDKTESIIKKMNNQYVSVYSFEKNQGKGSAVKYGIENSKGDIIVFTDADLPYPPEKIFSACHMIHKGADAVFGMRIPAKKGAKYPWYRTILSKGFGIFVRSVIHIRQKDTQCGFKVLKKEVAKKIFDKVTINGWGFDVEVVFLAEKLGYKTERIPVELSHDEKNSKINIVRDIVKMVAEVLSIRKKYKKGAYGL